MFDNNALDLWGLFASAFISSTIAPGGSEGVLGWLVMQSSIPNSLLLITATLGNTLGAMTTLALGFFTARNWPNRISSEKYRMIALAKLKRWGASALFFSWLPVIGDALCFAAGWLGLPVFRAVLIILIGKFFRYAAVVYFVS